MMLKTMASVLALLFAAFAIHDYTGTSKPQDDKKPQDADMEKIMAVYEKAAMPGEAHRGLAKMAGRWEQKGECPMGTISGTIEYQSILGGRFVTATTNGKVTPTGGKPPKEMNSFQVLGYDNVTKQYQTVWLDSMGTSIYFSPGTADASNKTITYEAPVKDAMSPEGRPFKVVVNIESDDKHVIEIWDSRKDGKTLEKEATITETRVK